MQKHSLRCSFLTNRRLSWLLILGLTVVLSGCQLPFMSKPDDGKQEKQVISAKANGSGFGGTGQVAQKQSKDSPTALAKIEGSGFGGTGVIGTITEFGSVWVNGIEVEYPQDVVIKSNLFNTNSLKIGQQVLLETVLDKSLPWTENIEVFYPLAGKIELVKNDHIMVDGKIVYLSKATRMASNLKLKRGQYVAVNGYPNMDKSWNATLISPNPAKKHLFQQVPKVNFSDKIRKLSIQTTAAQLSAWDQQFEGLPLNYIQTGESANMPLLLKADIVKGKITRYELQQLGSASVTNK